MAGMEQGDAVRAELLRRIACLSAGRVRPRDVAVELDAIRAIAATAGLHPAVSVAHLLDDALSRGERGVLVHGWLHVLRDAVASGRSDAAAADAFTAACAVRFVG